jgi:uncharacterized RDD family membrane protein YckC
MDDAIARRLEVETPEAVVVTYPLAGLGSRGLAAVLDVLALAGLLLAEVATGALALFLLSRATGSDLLRFGPWIVAALVVVAFCTYWGYYIFGEVFRNGRTWGKRVMGIRVVRDDGSRVGVLDSVVRNIVRIVDLLPATYAVGVVSMLLNRDAKRLGDMAAGTVVIDEPVESTALPEFVVAEERASLVRDFLRRRPQLTPSARWQAGVALLAVFGEQPGQGWAEEHVAGRLADLVEARHEVSG